MPVGATEKRSVDVRLVSATNSDLDAAVRAGTFREDFYYRLNVFAIRVPSLRERPDDVLPLAERFLASQGMPAAKLSPGARERLCAHTWPGNVRELENVLERALIVAGDDEIQAEHLATAPIAARTRAVDSLLVEGFELDAHERSLVHAAIERAAGNKSLAAKMLGITRRRLYSLLASFGDRGV